MSDFQAELNDILDGVPEIDIIYELRKDLSEAITKLVQKELVSITIAGMPELTPKQQAYIEDRIKQLKAKNE